MVRHPGLGSTVLVLLPGYTTFTVLPWDNVISFTVNE